jgi:hypothetical protein
LTYIMVPEEAAEGKTEEKKREERVRERRGRG